MEYVIVAAVAENGVIGDGASLPWESIPADKRQYRTLVADAPVVLGRRTFEFMRDDLPGDWQVVLSRSRSDFDIESAHQADSVSEATQLLEANGAETAYVLGGEAIYELFLPHADRMLISRIQGEYEGDAHFPEWDEAHWELVESIPFERFTREEWRRIHD